MLQNSVSTQVEMREMPQKSRLIERTPFFYGWVVLAAGTFGMVLTSPGQTYTISIFIEHFIADLGISRSLVSSFYTVGTLTGSFALPFVGRLLDRRGPRLVVGAVSLLFGVACIYMGLVQSGWMLLLGFVAVRMLGQGSLGMVSNYVINQWWMRRRGTILGLSGVLMALLGVGGFPNLVNWLIPLVGWRVTYTLLGVVLIAIMAPVGFIFFRKRPEEYGLLPDGMAQPPQRQAGVSARTSMADVTEVVEEHWTSAETVRTRAFWIIVAGLGSISMLSTGLTFHMVSIFADNQLSATAAAAVFVPIAVTTAVVNLVSGVLVDRISPRFLLSGALLLQVVALIMAQTLNGVPLAIVYGTVLGGLMGLQRTVSTVVWANYFGRLHLGSISGLSSTILVASSALGPLPMGVARDWLGEYNLALTLLALLPLVLSIVSLFIRRPRKATAAGP